jgi:aerobic-type carbon monoxide dehydrogenase small subunit (CoxS/CutS family)
MRLSFSVDGVPVEAEVHPGDTLLEALRALGFTSVKNGCAHGDCGTCAVLVEGRAVAACLLFAGRAEGRSITTVHGLAGDGGLHPLQRAMLDAGAVQCGFCIPGMLVTAAELLAANPDPSETEVRRALAGNLCRCTGYAKPVEAILAGAALLRAEEVGRG